MKTRKYVKFLFIDQDNHLCSTHGGSQVWRFKPVEGHPYNVEADQVVAMDYRPGNMCRAGTLHACRLRDVFSWMTTHAAIVEVEGDVEEAHDKIGASNMRLVRFAMDVDGLDVLVALANEAAAIAALPMSERPRDVRGHLLEFWKKQYPAGYFDGVEA